MRRAYLFLNGELLGKESFYLAEIEKNLGDIYCADGGANKLAKLQKFLPKEIWGDLDSISGDTLEKFKKQGTIVKKFPREKEFTDAELILEHIYKKYDEIYVISGLGGRKDHELTSINLMFKYKNVVFLTENEKIFLIDKNITLKNIEGKTVSFIPFSEKVCGITLKGFKYPLSNYTLNRGDSICVSNIAIEDRCEVIVKSGDLIGIINY